MNHSSRLERIGFTNGEAKVYLALIKLGSSKVGPIVTESGVAQSNVYAVLERLIEKGVASYVVKGKTKHFQAARPTALLEYISDQQKELDKRKALTEQMLPELIGIADMNTQQEAEIFVGEKGLRSAYERLLVGAAPDDELLHFYQHDQRYAKKSDLFYFSILDLLSQVPARGIVNYEYKKSKVVKKADFVEYRFADFPLPGNMEFCQDKTLMIAWEKPVTGILITSESVTTALRTYFESIWQHAKPS